MTSLPPNAHPEHLRKQAKALLRAARAGDPDALARLRRHLPAARDRPDAALAALRLHDAQSCLAREYGFRHWAELGAYLAWQREGADAAEAARRFASLIYAGDLAGDSFGARPALAQRLLRERPELGRGDVYLACALGDVAALRAALADGRAWIEVPGGPLRLPPLVAVCHSSLARLEGRAADFRACARLLLEAGADPNQGVGSRWPPHSLERPGEERLSALYGAAGVIQDAALVRLLLAAGADPDDGESLYHSVSVPACTRALLDAGARTAGTNALAHAIAQTQLESLDLLLAHGADPGEATAQGLSPLFTAIRLRRPAAFARALLRAGAPADERDADGLSAYAYAQSLGLVDVADLLREAGADTQLAPEDRFVAACARGDATQARALLAEQADLIAALGPARLPRVAELAMENVDAAVRLMVSLGWPVAARGGDAPFRGTPLNWAVFRGNAALAEFLLRHGAQWTERHGYGSDVLGTLSWASCNEPPGPGDWLGCARALVAHGLPRASHGLAALAPGYPASLRIAGRDLAFAEDVADFLLQA